MLCANGIVPRNPEPLEPQEHALDTPTSGTSSGKGERSTSKVKEEVESGSETDDEDREKALLVCFIFRRKLLTVYH